MALKGRNCPRINTHTHTHTHTGPELWLWSGHI